MILRERSLVALLVAETVSTTGMQMTWLALPWFVLTTTGSPGRMVLVLAAESIGLTLFGLPGGSLLSRLGSRRMMMLSDGIRGPLTLAIPILHWEGLLSFPLLLGLVFGLGAFGSGYFAAQRAVVPEVLGEDERVVGKANAYLQGATRVTLLLGPAAAGVLIAWLGAPSVIVIDAATYVVSFALVGGFIRTVARPAVEERGRFLDGLRWVVRDPLLRTWSAAFVAGDAAWYAFFAAVPVLVVADYGADPRIAGWIFASFGVGAVAGNVVSLRLQERADGLLLVGTLVYGQALPVWVVAFHVPAAAIAAGIFVSGLFNGLVNPSIHAILTLRAPSSIRPRVLTATGTVLMLSGPIGLAASGPVLDAAGAHPVLIGFAAVQTAAMALCSLASLRARATRREPALESA
ncbi:MAG TPA: MFS transporter [Gaiellaceae bacterium]|nr:MFS transporter [Gaiellaceae bacterium]